MSQATDELFQPVARIEYLDRLAALPEKPGFTPEFWGEVHDEVQAGLASLEAEVRRNLSGIAVTTGHTEGDRFFMFAYRTFSLPYSKVDPVVAGITFTPASHGVTVEADVSGEQTGDYVSPPTKKTVAESRQEVFKAARESARFICKSAERITAALTDPSRNVE